MPSRLTLDDRSLLVAAGAVALLLTIVTVAVGYRTDRGTVPTTYSAGSGGAKAVFLLLEQLQYPVTRWERSVRELPREPATLILADPQASPTSEDRLALRRFIDEGGRVIATGAAGTFFLPDHRTRDEPAAGLTWTRVASTSPSAITRAAPEITLAPQAYWSSESPALALYGERDKTSVVKYAVGKGDVMWWASATPLTNAGASEPGNLEFVLACIGDRHRRILWDEYVHGYRGATAAPFVAAPLGWIGLQLTLVAVVVLLTYSRRSGPVVPAATESRLSPLEFVRTLGAVYRRAGAASVAVDIAYQQFRYRLSERLGMSTAASSDELERAARARWTLDDPGFGELLRTCDRVREQPVVAVSTALELTQSIWEYSRRLNLVRDVRLKPDATMADAGRS
jgi:hypothetical protein